jgi:SAM-dependent methyltransferase
MTTLEALKARVRKHPGAKRLRRLVHPAWMGTLRRTMPLSPSFGGDRGRPVDRYYIEQFLNQYRQDIHGSILEVKDNSYAARFATGAFHCEVLDINPANPHATVIADLQQADSIDSGTFDCFLLTQTIGLIPNVAAALRHAHRILKPGGVLLLTAPGLGSRATERAEAPADYWRFTQDAIAELVHPMFGAENVQLHSYGNVLSAVALLMGIAEEELSPGELDVNDRRFPVVVTARAVKQTQ